MRVLLALPEHDFDPTETSVPWKTATSAGHEVVFATPRGGPPACDDRLITGRGFGLWRPFLRTRTDARELYAEMSKTGGFMKPMSLDDVAADAFDGLILPGGHAPRMREYLECDRLHQLVVEFFRAKKPVGAICHGVIAVARAVDPETGKSVLDGRKTTALPASMEMSAWAITALWLGSYYRTYKESVQNEVTRATGPTGEFLPGPMGLLRDRPDKLERGFVVRDGHYVSARWPGDAYHFAHAFCEMLD